MPFVQRLNQKPSVLHCCRLQKSSINVHHFQMMLKRSSFESTAPDSTSTRTRGKDNHNSICGDVLVSHWAEDHMAMIQKCHAIQAPNWMGESRRSQKWTARLSLTEKSTSNLSGITDQLTTRRAAMGSKKGDGKSLVPDGLAPGEADGQSCIFIHLWDRRGLGSASTSVPDVGHER
jgi:hypothetical protein